MTYPKYVIYSCLDIDGHDYATEAMAEGEAREMAVSTGNPRGVLFALPDGPYFVACMNPYEYSCSFDTEAEACEAKLKLSREVPGWDRYVCSVIYVVELVTTIRKVVP